MERMLAVALAFLAVGCATEPLAPKYYTLDFRPSGKALNLCPLRVERLDAAEPLERSAILIQATPVEVEYYARDYWAAPVAELAAQKLQAEFGDPATPEALQVSGTVLAFEQADLEDGSAQAHVKLAIKIRAPGAGPKEHPLLERTYEASIPAAAPQPAEVAKALSRAMEDLAVQIAADAASLKPSGI